MNTHALRNWLAGGLCLMAVLSLGPTAGRADGPGDNIPNNVRRIPKPGIEVPAETRQRLEGQLKELDAALASLQKSKDSRIRDLLPDVQIFRKAVHDALAYDEFFAPKELKIAEDLLAEGKQRAEQLARGEAPWTTATGLVVRGYVSKLDGSVQPYGLVVPKSYDPDGAGRYRLDLWFHGRGETLSELNFLDQRRKQVGTFAPADTIVLHPYGRYCNANKFAGEVDVFEALDSTKQRYRVDDDRITARGFSMGGASVWHLAVHYPGLWAAANPGAGFSETPLFLKVFQNETLKPTWWEKKLWHWYDAPDWSINLFHCPTVAYSGELDTQKQAADVMADALRKQGIELVHIIGPRTRHAYHPQARDEVDRRIAELATQGREPMPQSVHFTTYTLRYNRLDWLTVDALDEHWKQARVHATIRHGGGPIRIDLQSTGVRALTFSLPPGTWPFGVPGSPSIMIHDDSDASRPRGLALRITGLPLMNSDGSWTASLHRDGDEWKVGPLPADQLRKKHGLQGPIDDAFMEPFVFVRPTGKCRSETVEKWVRGELDRAVEHWRRHFRGEPRVTDDRDLTDEQIASMNLVLWGDPQSNAVLARIAEKLPIRYDGDELVVGDRRFAADHHAPILIFPNPLNPERYVVLNSSFTFRDYAYLNNARQVPMLPDWAIIDLRTPPGSIWPGKVAAADFFDEHWQLRPPHEEK